jgi:hypothetical protein
MLLPLPLSCRNFVAAAATSSLLLLLPPPCASCCCSALLIPLWSLDAPGHQIIMVAAHIENYWANRCVTFTMLLRLLRLVQLMRRLFVDSLVASGTSGLAR